MEFHLVFVLPALWPYLGPSTTSPLALQQQLQSLFTFARRLGHVFHFSSSSSSTSDISASGRPIDSHSHSQPLFPNFFRTSYELIKTKEGPCGSWVNIDLWSFFCCLTIVNTQIPLAIYVFSICIHRVSAGQACPLLLIGNTLAIFVHTQPLYTSLHPHSLPCRLCLILQVRASGASLIRSGTCATKDDASRPLMWCPISCSSIRTCDSCILISTR